MAGNYYTPFSVRVPEELLDKVKRIAALKKDNPQVDVNIFRSVHSVNLDTVIGWRSAAAGRHSFLEGYGAAPGPEEEL